MPATTLNWLSATSRPRTAGRRDLGDVHRRHHRGRPDGEAADEAEDQERQPVPREAAAHRRHEVEHGDDQEHRAAAVALGRLARANRSEDRPQERAGDGEAELVAVEPEPQAQRVGRAGDDGGVEPEEEAPQRGDERAAQEVRRDCAHGVRLRRCPGVVAQVQPAAYTSAPGSPCRAPLSSDPPPRRPRRDVHLATGTGPRVAGSVRGRSTGPRRRRRSRVGDPAVRPVVLASVGSGLVNNAFGAGGPPILPIVIDRSVDHGAVELCWRIARASRSTRLPLPVSPAEKYERTTPLPTLLRGAAVIVRRLRASTASTGPTRTAFGAFVTRRAQGRRRTDTRRRVSLAARELNKTAGALRRFVALTAAPARSSPIKRGAGKLPRQCRSLILRPLAVSCGRMWAVHPRRATPALGAHHGPNLRKEELMYVVVNHAIGDPLEVLGNRPVRNGHSARRPQAHSHVPLLGRRQGSVRVGRGLRGIRAPLP